MDRKVTMRIRDSKDNGVRDGYPSENMSAEKSNSHLNLQETNYKKGSNA